MPAAADTADFRALRDLRVVDVSTLIAGAYCSKLFADAGAEVIKVEPIGGDPLRRRRQGSVDVRPNTSSALFRYLNASKHGATLTDDDSLDQLEELIADADVLIESDALPLDIPALRQRHRHLVVASITPYGRDGPWRERAATEFVVQAESGWISIRGHGDRPPVQAGGRMTEWAAGLYAAVGSLAALQQVATTGAGGHIDCSLLEVAHLVGAFHNSLRFRAQHTPEPPMPSREVEAPSVEPTVDGYVGFMAQTPQHFENFLLLIDRMDLVDEPRWATNPGRLLHLDEWNEIVAAWTRDRSTAAIVDLARDFRVPVAEVNNGKTVLDNEQFRARRIFTDAPDASFVQPLPSYKFDGVRPSIRHGAPEPGQPLAAIGARSSVRAPRLSAPGGDLPLAGLRILDATDWWAGPLVSEIFAVLGADVIRLESTTRVPGSRTMVRAELGLDDEWWERGWLHLSTNHDKRSVALNLDVPGSQEVFYRLAEACDVLLENYSPRVIENFGIDYETLRSHNPELVFLRMPAFGLDGPWRDNLGWAQIMEQATGLAWITGYADRPPLIIRGVADPLAGLHAAFALLVALQQRAQTGKGILVESAMVESILNIAAEAVVEYTSTGAILVREGNRSYDAAPQGLYPCAGDERWLALAVTDDVHWTSLKMVMGSPSWAEDQRFDSPEGRRTYHDEIDAHLSRWSRTLDVTQAVDDLVAAGVPAGEAHDARYMDDHPQLRARGFYEELEHPVGGRHQSSVLPFRFAGRERWSHLPAPWLGEHNEEVLRDVGGLSAEEIAALEVAGIIGRRPQGV